MGAAVVVMAIWLFLLDRPTPTSVLWLTVGLLLLLAAVQFIAATAPRDRLGATPSDDDEGPNEHDTREISL
jgi:hypothetical protein